MTQEGGVDPSTAATPSAGGPVAWLKAVTPRADAVEVGTGPDRVGSSLADVRRWAVLADELDECQASAVLWACADMLGSEVQEPAPLAPRVLAFLLLGRTGDARRLLETCGGAPDHSAGDDLRDAVDAASGDAAAWSRVLNATAQAPSVFQYYVVAAAAECRGDLSTADQAWLTLRDRAGRRTGLVVSRAAVAEISASATIDAQQRTSAVYRNAVALTSPPERFARDPRWAADALRRLRSRGDVAGARLLGETIGMLTPRLPDEVSRELAPLIPTAMRRYRALVASLVVLLLCFVWLGVIWMVMAFIGREVFTRSVRVPGLSAQDSAAWRALRPFRVGRGYERDVKSLNGWVGLVVALASAVLAVVVLASVSFPGLSDTATMWIWLTTMITVPIVAVVVAQSVWRWWQLRARREKARVATVQQGQDLTRCQCWMTDWMRDNTAATYFNLHLVPTVLDEQLGTVISTLSDLGVWIRACPQSGITWLCFQTTAAQGLVLLRGAGATDGLDVRSA